MFMKLHRFFIAPQMFSGRIANIDDAEIVKQISKVLRLHPGEEIILLDGDGFEYITRLIKVGAREAQAEILKRQINGNEPLLKIALYQSIIKKDNFEWVLQKCTEVGVSSYVPIRSERSEKQNLNIPRMQKILREAAEQSERAMVPPLSEPQEFLKALQRAALTGVPTLVLHPGGDPIKNYAKNKDLFELNMFVGPEGGFSDAEIDAARELRANGRQIDVVSLGPRILRAETAGLVAAALMLNR